MTSFYGHIWLIFITDNSWLNAALAEMTDFHLVKHTENFQQNLTL